MKFGLLKYEENNIYFNLGDNIQSLAAKQFLPKVDTLISREKLGMYSGGKTKLIMNGWFTHNAKDWVPSKDIDPLFVSFHLNSSMADLLLSKKGIEYLKEHQPIGCRDKHTVNILKEKGIDAYFTGCLTLTLDSYKVDDSERDDKVYIVDPLYNYPRLDYLMDNYKAFARSFFNGKLLRLGNKRKHLKNIISKDLLESAEYITKVPPAKIYTHEEKFQMAEEILNKYARAKLVITSRIHCALPCLALGTPVIYINGFDNYWDSCRFEGIIDLFNRIDVNSKTGEFKANFPLKGKIDANTKIVNLEKHHDLAKKLKIKCEEFVKGDTSSKK